MATVLVDYENVSRSKGLDGIKYLTDKDNLKNSNIVISTDIAHGLKQLSCKNGEARVNLIQQKLKQVNIEVEYEKIKERKE